MDEYRDRVFEDRAIVLTGQHFLRCKFVRCRIVFTASQPSKLEDCVFDRCDWTFDGPAEDTLIFLSDLYRNLGTEGRHLVESVFESVRTGEVKLGNIPMLQTLLR